MVRIETIFLISSFDIDSISTFQIQKSIWYTPEIFMKIKKFQKKKNPKIRKCHYHSTQPRLNSAAWFQPRKSAFFWDHSLQTGLYWAWSKSMDLGPRYQNIQIRIIFLILFLEFLRMVISTSYFLNLLFKSFVLVVMELSLSMSLQNNELRINQFVIQRFAYPW